jgi:hypothetical protein
MNDDGVRIMVEAVITHFVYLGICLGRLREPTHENVQDSL